MTMSFHGAAPKEQDPEMIKGDIVIGVFQVGAPIPSRGPLVSLAEDNGDPSLHWPERVGCFR